MEAPRKLNIALVSELPPTAINGIVTSLGYTVDGLRRDGFNVMVMAPRARNSPKEYHGAKIVSTPSLGKNPLYPNLPFGLPLLGRKAKKELREFQPDVVHVVNPFIAGRGAIKYARRHNIPLVETYFTHLAPYAKRYHMSPLEEPVWRYMKRLHSSADVNLSVSPEVDDELRRRRFSNVELWLPGLDTSLFHPSKRSDELRNDLTSGHPERTILLSVGRLAREKSLDTLAPVMRSLVQEGKDVQLVVVGEGADGDRLRRLMKGLPVTFTGSLRGESLARVYASADMFVMPSTTETLGFVTLEAMASGIPVVASNSRATPNLLTDGREGYLVKPADSGELAKATSQLVGNVGLRKQMGTDARKRAEKFSWEASVRQLEGIYSRLTSRTRRT